MSLEEKVGDENQSYKKDPLGRNPLIAFCMRSMAYMYTLAGAAVATYSLLSGAYGWAAVMTPVTFFGGHYVFQDVKERRERKRYNQKLKELERD